MGSNTKKKPWTNLQKIYKNWSKGIKSDNFAYVIKCNSFTPVEFPPVIEYCLYKGIKGASCHSYSLLKAIAKRKGKSIALSRS